MQKLLFLLILSFFSAQSYAASCPDGSEPIKTVSADGSYYEYKCPVFPALPIPNSVDNHRLTLLAHYFDPLPNYSIGSLLRKIRSR